MRVRMRLTMCIQSSMIPVCDGGRESKVSGGSSPHRALGCFSLLQRPCSTFPLLQSDRLTFLHLPSRYPTDVPHHRPDPPLGLRARPHQPPDLISLPAHRGVTLVDLAEKALEEDARQVMFAHPAKVTPDGERVAGGEDACRLGCVGEGEGGNPEQSDESK